MSVYEIEFIPFPHQLSDSTVIQRLSVFMFGYFMRINLSRAMRKCVLCHKRTTKAQISLRIRAI